jgi:hypothetical protein
MGTGGRGTTIGLGRTQTLVVALAGWASTGCVDTGKANNPIRQ